MTREEAKAILECYLNLDGDEYNEFIEAEKVAIKALEQPILVAKAKAGDVEELLKIIDKGGAIISPNPITIEPIYADVLDKIRAEIIEAFSPSVCSEECGCLEQLLRIIDKYRGNENETDNL